MYDIGIPSIHVDFHTDVISYFFQALGCLFLSFLIKKKRIINERLFFLSINLVDILLGFISYICINQIISLLLGYLMNFAHGLIAGMYLWYLSKYVDRKKRALTFGFGYGLGTIGSYIISKIIPNNFLNNRYVFIVYSLSILLIYYLDNNKEAIVSSKNNQKIDRKMFIILILFVLIINIVKNGSFYFPMQDIELGISLELSRCAYAVGLLIAGIINDINRKHGLILCIISLIFPFAMLSLEQLIQAKIIIWVINYFFNGFFNVYRIILFSDLSDDEEKTYLSGFGLTFGRFGDCLGALLGVLFVGKEVIFILFMIVLYLFAIVLFFSIYNKLYNQVSPNNQNNTSYVDAYGFSKREKDVYMLILQNKSNKEISDELFISNNTVKTHIKNILKKTGCRNKQDLIRSYKSN